MFKVLRLIIDKTLLSILLIYACHDTQVVTMTNFVRSKLSYLNYTIVSLTTTQD
jgi:hypothetical protein